MRNPRLSLGVAVAAASLGGSFPVWAGEGSLVVVVEAGPGAEVAPADVRAAVRAELGEAVLAPRDAKAADASRLLVVALDERAIQVTLWDGASQAVTRTIAAPGARAARLQAIGWLAGNIARDQVTGIVDGRPHADEDTRPWSSQVSSVGAAPQLPIEPPPQRSVAAASDSAAKANLPTAAETLSKRPPEAASDRGPAWAVTAAYGTALVTFPVGNFAHVQAGQVGSISEVRVQRRGALSDVTIGGVIQIADLDSVSLGRYMVGLAGLAGERWDHRRWFLEVTGGVGFQLGAPPTYQRTTTQTASSGFEETLVATHGYQPALFGVLRSGFGVRMSRTFEAVAELGICAGSGGAQSDFLSTAIALRMRLP